MACSDSYVLGSPIGGVRSVIYTKDSDYAGPADNIKNASIGSTFDSGSWGYIGPHYGVTGMEAVGPSGAINSRPCRVPY
jgi:hypothetical protein